MCGDARTDWGTCGSITLNGLVITMDDRAEERVTFRVAEERLALLGGFPLVDASSPRSLCRGPRQVKRRTC